MKLSRRALLSSSFSSVLVPRAWAWTHGVAALGQAKIYQQFDSSWSSAPAPLPAAFNACCSYLAANIQVPISLTIQIGYGTCNSTAMASTNLSQNLVTSVQFGNYSTWAGFLNSLAISTNTKNFHTSMLAGSDPSGGQIYQGGISLYELYNGLSVPASWTILANGAVGAEGNIYLGLNTAANGFNYFFNGGPVAGKWDAFGAMMHEITEGMGRRSAATVSATPSTFPQPLDAFKYTAANTKYYGDAFTGGSYFSLDNGTTNYRNFTTNSTEADPGDWDQAINDADNGTFSTNTVQPFHDAAVLDALGWEMASLAAVSCLSF
jgi:hypothetical protein